MATAMLSTIDNPFDYFKEFEKWHSFDMDHSYGCLSIVARFLDMLSIDADSDNEVDERKLEEAIDNFIISEPSGNYIKIKSN